MIKSEFMSKIALTLEVSIKMTEGWIDKISKEITPNEEEMKRLSDYKNELHALLLDVKELTESTHVKREELESSANWGK